MHNQTLEPQIVSHSKTKTMPQWHVVLLDDDDHSYEYVITMLMRLFGHNAPQAYQMALEVDSSGSVIVDTCNRERAELKQEQIHNFGSDPLIPNCTGSMTAVLEAAP